MEVRTQTESETWMLNSVMGFHHDAIVSAMQAFWQRSRCEGFLLLPYTAQPHFVVDGNVFVVKPQDGVAWEELYNVDKVEARSDVYLLGIEGKELIEHPLGVLADLDAVKHTKALTEGCHGHNDLICQRDASYRRCDFVAERVSHFLQVCRNNN